VHERKSFALEVHAPQHKILASEPVGRGLAASNIPCATIPTTRVVRGKADRVLG